MVANMNPGAGLQDSYDYTLQSDGECESLDSLPSFSNHPSPFENENAQGSTAFRLAGSSTLNQPSIHPLSLHPTTNFDNRTAYHQNGNEIPFQTGSSVSMSPLTSSRGSSSTSPSSAASSFTYVPQSQYALNSNVSYHVGSQPGAASSLYSPSNNYTPAYLHVNPFENRPRLTSIPSSSGMPPPSRNPNDQSPVSPQLASLAFRGDYPTLTQLPRASYSGHSTAFQLTPTQASLHAMSRGYNSTLSHDSQTPTSYGYNTSMQLDPNSSLPATGQPVAPPFAPTKPFAQLQDRNRTTVHAEIHAKIDKGFFKADADWTCYRRNYFAVACSYSLRSDGDNDADRLFLKRQDTAAEQVQALAMTIAAKVDGEDGKDIELVQHTPKRDKGPMNTPEKKELRPNPTGNLGMFASSGAFSAGPPPLTGEYDPGYHSATATTDSQNVANFERIQFKKATANNGKRRAAQQYFHIVVELFVRVAKGGKSSSDTEWVKVAHRLSAQMVVRGRSPGHYQDERRGSSTSMGGPGNGHGGDYAGAGRDLSLSGGGALGGSHGMSGGSYSHGLGHGTYRGHHHMGMNHMISSDSHSTGSSASSSMRSSSLGPFADGVSGGQDVPMEDAPPSQTSAPTGSYGYYGAGVMYDGHASAAAPRLTSPTTGRATSGSGTAPALSPPFHSHYLTVPPLKDEQGYSRAPPIKSEPQRRLDANPNLQLPSFYGNNHTAASGHGQWSGPGDTLHPPRDCRSGLVETGKAYYPTTQV